MIVPAGVPALTRRSNWHGDDAIGAQGAEVDAGRERRGAAVRLPDRGTVQQRGIRYVRRVGRHGIAQHQAGRGRRRGVLHGNRVAQHVARIDDARRTLVTEQHDAFLGVEQRQVANHVACRVIDHWCRRIVGRLIGDATRDTAHETLVGDHRAVDDGRVDHDVESDRGDVAGRGGRHRARRPLPGALISMPLTSADCVPASATVVPLSVVLPAT